MPALTIAMPCHEDWSIMTPQGAGRHCAACDQVVIDLLGLGPSARIEALARLGDDLTRQPGLRACVRGYGDGSGRLLAAPPARRRMLTNAIAGILATVAAGNLAAADSPPTLPATTPVECHPALVGEATLSPTVMGGVRPLAVMGDVAVAPRPKPVPPPTLMGVPVAPGPMTPVPLAPGK